VTFDLTQQPHSMPIRYPELARALGIEPGETAPLGHAREAVLNLRRRKGMVVDPDDPDSVSAGSFFTNPILDPGEFERLAAKAQATPPRYPEPDGRIKTSAAWLVERAGYARGYGDPATVALSSKHTLALTNRGGGTATQLLALAREIANGVEREFGVKLVPEPVLVGAAWADDAE
jgi:UDP-N-acetylmuramate dehydrogenase